MDDVVILKVDVDDCEDIAAQYNVYNLLFVLTVTSCMFQITAMPTFIFIKSKAKVADLTGANIDKLKEIVQANK